MEFLAIIYYYPASNTVSVIIYALNEWREPNIFGVEGGNDREVRKELAIPFFWIPGSLMNEQSWITSICLHFKLENISLLLMTLLISLQLICCKSILPRGSTFHCARFPSMVYNGAFDFVTIKLWLSNDRYSWTSIKDLNGHPRDPSKWLLSGGWPLHKVA